MRLDQDGEQHVYIEEVELRQLLRLAPVEAVQLLFALQDVLDREDTFQLRKFFELSSVRTAFQMGDLGLAHLPVKSEEGPQEAVAHPGDASVEGVPDAVGIQSRLQPVDQSRVARRALRLEEGGQLREVEGMRFAVRLEVRQSGNQIGIVGHYSPNRILRVAGRR